MKKQELAKLTLTALASSLCVVSPVSAIDINQTDATILSAGCAGGCGTKHVPKNFSGNLADNDSATATRKLDNNPQIEKDFRDQLDDKTKVLFDSLDSTGKATAIQLSATVSDKNEAVRQAARKMTEQPRKGY